MTPKEKEKANELIAKFSAVGLQRRSEGIQCALIAVDEILSLCPLAHRNYWINVKLEIEKL